MSALDYIKHAWNLFAYDQNVRMPPTDGVGYATNPIRYRPSFGNERSLINSVVNRIALDAASIDINHVRLDENNRFKDIENSKLNQCLTVEANIDQTGRGLVKDIVMSMLDEGVVAVVPVDTDLNPHNTGGYDILSLRTGKIGEWKPKHVLVNLYDDRVGLHKDVWLPKEKIAIIENPMFSIMNEHNSTMQRLIRKLSLMDGVDEEIGSGNMNLLVQLPYAVKTDHQRKQAKERIEMLEEQMKGNKLGIGYMDSTEKITQLNRPLENQFLKQIEYLTAQLLAQLGITQSILDGTADDKTLNNYFNRTVEPIIGAIAEEFHRKFLTKTARSQGQAIWYFRNPFKLVPISEIPDLADKLTRNEIVSSNEMRQVIGFKPSDDPAADELRNKNLNKSEPDQPMNNNEREENQNDEEKV